MWLYFHIPTKNLSYSQEDLTELLSNGSSIIAKESFACEIKVNTVAAVIATRGFLNLDSAYLSSSRFSCDNKDCSFMTSNCLPWQSSECGSTFIRYKIDSNRKIISSSFECLDVP